MYSDIRATSCKWCLLLTRASRALSPSVLAQGDACATCHTVFLRSFITYDHLPAVLFELAPDITHDEALGLLSEDPSTFEVGDKPGCILSWIKLHNQGSTSVRDEPICVMCYFAQGDMDHFARGLHDHDGPIVVDR